MGRRAVLGLAASLAVAMAVLEAAEGLRIVPIVRDEQVLVSVDLDQAYTTEIREAIASGLRTTFTYDVELRMVVPAWVDRTIATMVINTSDEFDNLTRRHTLTRAIDGRVVETMVTEDEAAVRRWLTSLRRLRLCNTSKLDSNRDYYVRISARSRPSGASIVGWASSITSQVKFTYIP